MTGGRYIKQAIIAALCEHPEQDKYKTRAFSGENLDKVMEAMASETSRLSKADFFTADDEGKIIIDTPGFWRNFDKIRDIVHKNGDVFKMDDFLSPLGAPGKSSLLDNATQHGGLAKLFSFDVWQGRFDEMERLWYRVRVPARKDVFRNDGLLDPALKRRMFAAEGRECPEDRLSTAGLSVSDFRNAFIERASYDEVKRKLNAKGDYFRKDYLMLPDSSGDTVFFYQEAWDRFVDLSRDMKKHGEQFEVADFIRQVGLVHNILGRAAERKALDKVFTPELWEGRLPEMLDLWSHVKEGWRNTMGVRDFDRAYGEAEGMTYGRAVDFKGTLSKVDLLSPLNEGSKPVLALGLRAFWQNFDAVQSQLAKGGEKLTLADLRRKSGEMEQSCLMTAVKLGHFDKVTSLCQKNGDAMTTDDFLSKDRHGTSLLNILAERNELSQAFQPDLWAGRVSEMKQLWSHVRISDRTQVNIQEAEVAAKQATLRLQSKNKFKL